VNPSRKTEGQRRFSKEFWEAARTTKSRNGPAKKIISMPIGRTFRRRARPSAKVAPSWSRVTRSPRRVIPFFPIPARKHCSGWACLRTGSSFGSDRIFSINGRPWRERR
jgi:hypothetical protein